MRYFAMRLITTIFIFAICNLYASALAAEDALEVLPTTAIWVSGALPGQFSVEGDWIWSDEVTQNEVKTHENSLVKGIEAHGFRTDAAVRLSQDSKVIQYVKLDADNMPSGIMLKLFLAAGKEIILYWEGDEEAFVELDEYITAWYIGAIPNPGKWTGLEIDFKEFDIEDAELVGMEFIVNSGRVWWGETIIISPASS